jgi:hypothetical protein
MDAEPDANTEAGRAVAALAKSSRGASATSSMQGVSMRYAQDA